jgi:peptidoglycan hydrolase-like protein with peptidoglycan-binding domain
MDGRGWQDIAYNSVICRHGVIFQGRWIGTRSAANGTNRGNSSSYAHCVLMGTGDDLTPEAKIGLRTVTDVFRGSGAGPKLWAHRDWKPTACPGNDLTAFVRAGMPIPTSTPRPPAVLPRPPASNGGRWPRRGDRGGAVPQLQQRLNRLGGKLAVDGVFGPATERAVQTLQAFFGLDVDGIVGPQTAALISELLAKVDEADDAPPRIVLPSATIRRGDSGDQVKRWQAWLDRISAGTVAVDGDFGPETERRTRQFQAFFGLDVDGIVGPRTRAVAASLAQRL